MEITDKLNSWIALDTLDFQGIVCDATKWEDGTYTIIFNFFTDTCEDLSKLDETSEDIPYKGLTFYTQMEGESLHELYVKLSIMMEMGFFKDNIVSGHGTLWDSEGNEINEINWSDYQVEDDEERDIEEYLEKMITKKPVTLH
jgi:hypothetical protein